MRKFLSLLLSLAMVLSLNVTAFAAETAEAQDLAGKTVILHTGDVHGAIDGYGSLAALRNEYEDRGAEVILVDSGDFAQGSVYVGSTEGADAVTMMNAVGYDVVTLGNHEFDYGTAQLKETLDSAEFEIVCANILKNGKLIYDANCTYTTASGLKIGFFGMDTPTTKTQALPALVKELTFFSRTSSPTVFDCAAQQVKALSDTDLVICLSHFGAEEYCRPYSAYDLYNQVKGIDFIIDGHSHSVLTEGVNGEPIQSVGTGFANIGVIVIDDASKTIEKNFLYEVTADTAKDAAVAAVAKTIIDRIDAEYGKAFAKSIVSLNGEKAGPGNRDSETNNGDLITDAMRWKIIGNDSGLTVDADHVVAITNGGSIRAWIRPGDVSKKDINNVLPFGNTLCVVYVTGAELLEALEASTYCTPEQVGGFPQVSGIRYTIDTAKPYEAGEAYPGSEYQSPASINRVTVNDVNGKPFDPEAVYAVVTSDFCAAGGDTYYAFASATAQFDTGIPLDETVMEYITEELGGVIGEEYAEPQGRITVIAGTEKPAEEKPVASADSYTVVAGDCLWNIAYKFYGSGKYFGKIAEANGVKDPYVIYVGQVLTVPAK